MHLFTLNTKGFGVWETTNQSSTKGQPAFSRKSAAGWPFFYLISENQCQLNLLDEQ